MTTFPTWLTGPNGERRVFNSADEVPDGWAPPQKNEKGEYVPTPVVAAAPEADDTGPAVELADAAESEDLTAAAEHIGERMSDDLSLPEGWRELHYKKLVKLAVERGHEGEMATKADAIAWLEAWEAVQP